MTKIRVCLYICCKKINLSFIYFIIIIFLKFLRFQFYDLGFGELLCIAYLKNKK